MGNTQQSNLHKRLHVEAEWSERLLCAGLTWEVTGMICPLLWLRGNSYQLFSTNAAWTLSHYNMHPL